MLRKVVLLCAFASASAYLGAPVAPLLRSAPGLSSAKARPLRTQTSVQMVDAEAVKVALAFSPGFMALGMAFQSKWAEAGMGAKVAQEVMPTQAEMMPTARANFKRWNDALQTKNPKVVANLYTPTSDLSFLPTISPQHIKKLGATEEYFEAFVQKHPFGTITDDSVTVFSPTSYLHTGMYTFMLGEQGARTPVEARFSYAWKFVNGDWKITHHHSSVRPADPAAAPAEPAQEAPAAAAPSSGSAPSNAAMLGVARDNFNRWNDALQTKNPKTVANLYAPTEELSFLPTVSPKHITALGNTEEYFKDFVLKNPFGTITDDKVTVFDDGNSYLHSGMYTFELGDKGARTPVEARFSYVWKNYNGDWKITHHHSSVRPAEAAPPPTPDQMMPIARENFMRWNDALQTKNPKTVANLYSSQDLSFLPTVSPKHIKALGNTEEYFVAFVQKNPFGTITDDSVTVFDDGNSYLHSGMYTFELGDKGARTPVEARFSYVWRKFGSDWKITHHHSSVRPVEAAPAPSAESMHSLARENFKKWNDALQTKNPKTVANLYTSGKELSFLPTISPKHIKELDSTQDYFTAFVQKNPFGTITDDSVTVVDNGDGYLHSGLYTFELGDKGARTPVEARFSYMWKKVNGDWKITHHHSSARPADPAAAPASDSKSDEESGKLYKQAVERLNTETALRIEQEKELKEVVEELNQIKQVMKSDSTDSESEKVAEVMTLYRQAVERLNKETTLRIEQEKALTNVVSELNEIKAAIPQLTGK